MDFKQSSGKKSPKYRYILKAKLMEFPHEMCLSCQRERKSRLSLWFLADMPNPMTFPQL